MYHVCKQWENAQLLRERITESFSQENEKGLEKQKKM